MAFYYYKNKENGKCIMTEVEVFNSKYYVKITQEEYLAYISACLDEHDKK